MNIFSENEIRETLKRSKATVTFKKKSTGEIRTMDCTLREDLIPEIKTQKTFPSGLVVAFDTNKAEWRSFYVESVTSLEECA